MVATLEENEREESNVTPRLRTVVERAKGRSGGEIRGGGGEEILI